jgi:4-phytase/acid phosphatase
MRHWLLCLLVAAGVAAAAAQPPAPPPSADSDLRFVLILSRHGVRSPIQRTDNDVGRFAADPWPKWEVPPGILTPHGERVMELMGAYYRLEYTAQGLLTGDPARDAAGLFFRADANQRTTASARAIGQGLVPGVAVVVHAFATDRRGDPLLDPDGPLGRVDADLRTASLLGRIGGDHRLLLEEYRPALETLERVLVGGDGTPPPGKTSLLDLPANPALWQTAQHVVDALTLAYADGKPLAEVGWGRLHPADMLPLMSLSALNFNLTWATPLHAKAATSNLAYHLLATLEQAARGQAVEGALGSPGQRFVVLVGHDSNIIPLGSLLDLGWRVPGAPANPFLPGGALVFELRRRRADGEFLVRTSYVSPTLDQSREARPFTLDHPPASAPIFVPDCSTAAPGYDAPLDRFAAHVRAAIDPQLIEPEPAEVR